MRTLPEEDLGRFEQARTVVYDGSCNLHPLV